MRTASDSVLLGPTWLVGPAPADAATVVVAIHGRDQCPDFLVDHLTKKAYATMPDPRDEVHRLKAQLDDYVYGLTSEDIDSVLPEDATEEQKRIAYDAVERMDSSMVFEIVGAVVEMALKDEEDAA